MNTPTLQVSACGTHHVDGTGQPAYAERFDEVLKFHPPALAPVRRGDLSWHIRRDGSPAYARRFVRTFGYYDGLAAVVASDGWHHITPDGCDAYSARHAWCGNFQNGLCTVRAAYGAYHHIGPDGGAIYGAKWRYAGDYRDGVAVVQAPDGHSTHIDLKGDLVHGCWFVDLDVFHKGFARARDEDGWTHVDAVGRPIYARRFHAAEPFYNGQARVERFDGALEVIDETGAMVAELRPPRRSDFAELSADLVGFWRTQTIGTAVALGVFEAVPATGSEVAERCLLREDGALRLLRALGELHLVSCEAGRWILTPRGTLLRGDHALTLADAAMEYAGPFAQMWRQLPAALSQKSVWSAPDVFGEVAADDARRDGHHRMLRSYARHDYVDVGKALDLRGDERIIDAGGGLGVLASLTFEACPSVEITVLERPEVVAMAPASDTGLRWHAGSLFEPWGISADVVLLSRVLHDWDDDEVRRILAHARAALSVGGRIYIVEMLIADGHVAGGLCDLHLLMATGGRERSAEAYGQLLNAAGFELKAIQRLPALPSVLVGVAK